MNYTDWVQDARAISEQYDAIIDECNGVIEDVEEKGYTLPWINEHADTSADLDPARLYRTMRVLFDAGTEPVGLFVTGEPLGEEVGMSIAALRQWTHLTTNLYSLADAMAGMNVRIEYDVVTWEELHRMTDAGVIAWEDRKRTLQTLDSLTRTVDGLVRGLDGLMLRFESEQQHVKEMTPDQIEALIRMMVYTYQSRCVLAGFTQDREAYEIVDEPEEVYSLPTIASLYSAKVRAN